MGKPNTTKERLWSFIVSTESISRNAACCMIDNTLYINSLHETESITIHSVSGIKQTLVKNQAHAQFYLNLPKGIYIVQGKDWTTKLINK
jgi:hypothetical protein